MRSNTAECRLLALETAYASAMWTRCGRCWGRGYIIIGVPEDATDDDARYHPTHCPECGIPLRSVLQIIGMSEDELP